MHLELRKDYTHHPVRDFVLKYLLWVSVLYSFIYFENLSPLLFIHTLHTDLSIYLTGVWIGYFDLPIDISYATLTYENGLQLEILDECNGLAAFLFLLAAILAYPAKKKDKIIWIIFTYFILMLANAIRIDWILYHVISHPEAFVFVHEVVGRYAIAFLTLILFYLFTDKSTPNTIIITS